MDRFNYRLSQRRLPVGKHQVASANQSQRVQATDMWFTNELNK